MVQLRDRVLSGRQASAKCSKIMWLTNQWCKKGIDVFGAEVVSTCNRQKIGVPPPVRREGRMEGAWHPSCATKAQAIWLGQIDRALEIEQRNVFPCEEGEALARGGYTGIRAAC
uniref:Uncharacterized protein n=1 Tax=Coccolithus braarudii TaxID=221442 RepID=A0A7S0PZB4_9EUKA